MFFDGILNDIFDTGREFQIQIGDVSLFLFVFWLSRTRSADYSLPNAVNPLQQEPIHRTNNMLANMFFSKFAVWHEYLRWTFVWCDDSVLCVYYASHSSENGDIVFPWNVPLHQRHGCGYGGPNRWNRVDSEPEHSNFSDILFHCEIYE